MNISRLWLNDYVPLNCDDATLCRKLTMAGIEVEKIESEERTPAGVVVAKILERKPHPGSDHLSVCRVFDGTAERQIVCGAPNCDAGKTVPLATVGTVFHTPEGDFKIKKSKLRGVDSEGMMCSGKELGLNEDHEGLMILDDRFEAGTPLSLLFPGSARLELEVTPNRPDWLSVWGIARDVSCLLDVEAKLPEIKVPECTTPAPGLVAIEAPDLCRRYIGRVIRNVKVGPSPKWMVERLESVGLRSINNVVDVTNFVLMELGQPLHVFDFDKLAGGRVVARRAKPGEKITTLDGKRLDLDEQVLVIADAEKPAALAGVMGGLDSGVTAETVNVLLESAAFDPVSIRSTSRRFNLASDSSYRFERGVDPETTALAGIRAAQLILETAGGQLATEAVEVGEALPERKTIRCRFDRIRALIGTEVSNERMTEIFRKLRLEVSGVTGTGCTVTAPLFRRDLEREADLAEEVARINGLDEVPLIPVSAKCCHPASADAYRKVAHLRDAAAELGFCECCHYSIVGEAGALADSRFASSDLVKLSNPINNELAVMRPSLFGGFLGAVERNLAHGNGDLRLFELGKVFCADPKKFPEERHELALLLTGCRHPERYSSEAAEKFDFFDLKGAVESLLERYGFRNWNFLRLDGDRRFRPGCAAEVRIEGKCAGALGEVNPEFSTGWRSHSPVFVALLDAAPFFAAEGRPFPACKPLPLFPATERDIAFVADAALEHAKVIDFIRRCKAPYLESVRLFDIFADDKLKAAGRKSLAYKLTFRNRERTLTDVEINRAVDQLRAKLAVELQVELR